MADKNEISNELKELGSFLAADIPSAPYTVPDGYFDGLASAVLSRVRALDANSPDEELAAVSPLLATIRKVSPYSVPPGYFESLDEQLPFLTQGEGTAPARDATEEIESISPLLSSLKAKNTYSVPDGYFENLVPNIGAEKKEPARVVSFIQRSWVKYAAAAVVFAFVATFALINRGDAEKLDPSTKSFAWVEKNLNKVSTDEIAKFVEQVNGETADPVPGDATVELGNLLKDVSDKEIADFLADTQAADFSGDDDLILN
jgi:hypothetical protein